MPLRFYYEVLVEKHLAVPELVVFFVEGLLVIGNVRKLCDFVDTFETFCSLLF